MIGTNEFRLAEFKTENRYLEILKSDGDIKRNKTHIIH